jgi:hypothetical protein
MPIRIRRGNANRTRLQAKVEHVFAGEKRRLQRKRRMKAALQVVVGAS